MKMRLYTSFFSGKNIRSTGNRKSLTLLAMIAAFGAFSLLPTTQSSAQGSLLQWNTFGNAGTETSEPSVYNDANVQAANLVVGPGVTPANNGNRLGGSDWFDTGNNNPSTISEAIAGNN
ncbi:MAG: hypothetical protein IT242_03770 [Bacteroidia bacterium]|nr:hypothetical protein [Bacteroidia bacterium]